MRKIITILIILLIHTKYSQVTEKNRELISKTLYSRFKNIFEKSNFISKEENYKESDFYNDTANINQIDSCIKIIRKTAYLEIKKKYNDYSLFFTSKLTHKYGGQINDHLKINLKKSNLSDESGRQFSIGNQHNSSNGYEKIEFRTNVKSKYGSSSHINGEVIYDIRFLIDYDIVELTNENIGEKFILNECEFKLKAIIQNKIILEKFCSNGLVLKSINFSFNGMVFKPYSYSELVKLKEKDDSVNLKKSFSQSTETVYKRVFDIFEKNPNISFEEFDKIMNIQTLNNLKKEDKYIVINSVNEFKNKFILYTPIYKTETISIKI